LEIIDGTHEIPRYDIWSASYRLYHTVRFWPAGTIFVSVVDPGVGTARKACVAATKDGYYIVTPDNGALTHISRDWGLAEVREIDEEINRLRGKNTESVGVFHGRDVFAYCAARLASGIITFGQVGPSYPVEEIVTLPVSEPYLRCGAVVGIFEIGDPNFGNLWTNIPFSMFEEAGFRYGDLLRLTISRGDEALFGMDVLFQRSFGFVGHGEPVIYTNELMNIALAISMGSAVDEYHLGYGSDWKVAFEKAL